MNMYSLLASSAYFESNGSIYTLTSVGTWEEAQAQAQALGGNLVTINDSTENSFLVGTFSGTENLWIGLTDKVSEGTFEWISGETSDYRNWFPGEPNNVGNEDYIGINNSAPGTWNDYPSTYIARGIVENKFYEFNGGKYLLSGAGTWDQAQAQAQAMGGNLVTINSQAEQDWLFATFGQSSRWTGLTDQVTEGEFKWISGESVTYTNWNVGEPNNSGNEDYAVMDPNLGGRWNDSLIDGYDLPQGIIEIRPEIFEFNGSQYILSNPGTWEEAQAQAQAMGGNLVTINSPGEQDWLFQTFGESSKWIGLTDQVTEGKFKWISGEPVTYTNWDFGEPNNLGNEDYVEMLTNGKWNDLPVNFDNRQGIIEISQYTNITFTGTAGNDTFNGTTGADTFIGLAGNDTYTVNNSGDVVTENLNEGTDTVKSDITYTLPDNVEKLTLNGSSNLNGTGNALNNTLTGNSGNNTLTGLAGNDTINGKASADTMIGGLGNDTYTVDNIGDVVTENLNEGTDTVKSSVNYTLGANLENLTLTGSANLNGVGNDLKNKLTGNTGANILNGGAGADTLAGKAGNDTFVFRFGESTVTALDRVSDFVIGADKIDLLTQGGAVTGAPAAFTRAPDSAVTNINTILTNVFFDSDGATVGNQALGLNSAALVKANTATYLIINDGAAGFQSANDLVINLTGITGTLPALGTIPVANFFV